MLELLSPDYHEAEFPDPEVASVETTASLTVEEKGLDYPILRRSQ